MSRTGGTNKRPEDTADSRWQDVADRNHAAAGRFCYGVITTGIFCVPGCPSRLPRRENAVFFDTPAQAVAAGYRACKRCRPDDPARPSGDNARVVSACRAVEAAVAAGDAPPSLGELAAAAGLSPAHFQRRFVEQVGVSPKVYGQALRDERVRAALQAGVPVTRAIYEAGYNSAARFYERSADALGMQPRTYGRGGAGLDVWHATARTTLGLVMAAFTWRGVCSVEFGESEKALLAALEERFDQARIMDGGRAFGDHLAAVVALVETPAKGLDLPLDIRGTAFQHRVWAQLRAIPPGETRTYSQVADALGAPESVRAVASACARNRIAVAVPCHRVLRKDGSLGGYYWGLERKKALLEREGDEEE